MILFTRRLALFGSVGPVLFVVIAIVITMLEWDFLHRLGWHLVQDSSVPYPSSTAMGPYGLLQTFNFIQAGLSIIATATGLWRTVQPRPRLGIGFVALAGVAIVLAMFTTDGTTNTPTTWHGTIHGVAFILMLFATLLASLALAIQLRNNDQWKAVARVSIATPIVIVATLLLTGAVKQAGGLLSIVSLLVIFGWYELLALRLLSLAVETFVGSLRLIHVRRRAQLLVLAVVGATVLLIGASIFTFHHALANFFDAGGGSCGGG